MSMHAKCNTGEAYWHVKRQFPHTFFLICLPMKPKLHNCNIRNLLYSRNLKGELGLPLPLCNPTVVVAILMVKQGGTVTEPPDLAQSFARSAQINATVCLPHNKLNSCVI